MGNPKQLMKEMSLNLKEVFPGFIPEYKISRRGVPYVKLREFNICYYKTNDFYRIFVGNKKVIDILDKDKVVEFFKLGGSYV